VLTVTVLAVLDAELAITKFTVMVVPSELTVIPFIVIPPPVTFTTDEPVTGVKLVPVKVTETVVPWVPEVGLIVLNVGAGGRPTVNASVFVVPMPVVTPIALCVVAAEPEIVMVAVTVVSFTTWKLPEA
jgi:hypothetical protein